MIEIPQNINALFSENVDLVLRWRETTWRAFTKAIEAGYTVLLISLVPDRQRLGAKGTVKSAS